MFTWIVLPVFRQWNMRFLMIIVFKFQLVYSCSAGMLLSLVPCSWTAMSCSLKQCVDGVATQIKSWRKLVIMHWIHSSSRYCNFPGISEAKSKSGSVKEREYLLLASKLLVITLKYFILRARYLVGFTVIFWKSWHFNICSTDVFNGGEGCRATQEQIEVLHGAVLRDHQKNGFEQQGAVHCYPWIWAVCSSMCRDFVLIKQRTEWI